MRATLVTLDHTVHVGVRIRLRDHARLNELADHEPGTRARSVLPGAAGPNLPINPVLEPGRMSGSKEVRRTLRRGGVVIVDVAEALYFCERAGTQNRQHCRVILALEPDAVDFRVVAQHALKALDGNCLLQRQDELGLGTPLCLRCARDQRDDGVFVTASYSLLQLLSRHPHHLSQSAQPEYVYKDLYRPDALQTTGTCSAPLPP